MARTWTLGVLHADAENVAWLGGGQEATNADAFDAATDALVNAAAAG